MNSEIRKLVLNSFEEVRSDIQKRLDQAEPIGARLNIAFMDSAGVLCTAICEYYPRRIVAISVPMTKTGIVRAEWLHQTTAYCDRTVNEIIEITRL